MFSIRASVVAVTVLLVVFSTAVFPCRAAFTVLPTMDLGTSSNCSGATDAVYTFHAQNPDLAETVIAFSVPVPAGYSINPTYLTTTPDIIVLTAVYGFVGQPISGYLRLNTTGTSGLFIVYARRINPPTVPPYVPIGTATVIPPTLTIPGSWSVVLGAPNNGEYIDLSFVAGFFTNPSTPGVYTWGPSTATPSSGSPVTMNPRPGFTNQVGITVCPVGGYVEPMNRLVIFTPYLALFGVIAAVAAFVTAPRKKSQN